MRQAKPIAIRVRGLALAGVLLFTMGAVPNASAQTAPAGNGDPNSLLSAWQTKMAQVGAPKSGCFVATYPNVDWREVGCVPGPAYPMPPKHGPGPEVVGNGLDVSAQVPTSTSFISSGFGSFDSVSGVTSVTGPLGNMGAPVANAYTLQLNTNPFTSTACAGSPNPGCQGWEQFVFWNPGAAGGLFIQYWLLKYNATCPGGWSQFTFTTSSDIYCVRNAPGGVTPVPNQPISNLAYMKLSGTVSATADSATFSTGTTVYMKTGDNSVHAAAGWQAAEFNVFGAGGNNAGGGMATFNSGATVVPRTRIIYGGNTAPACVATGFTGETNNLTLGPTPPATTPPGPAVAFTESTAGGAFGCASATTIGDTHLRTINGLLYDFQATGDFVLAQVDDTDFLVQARQVSGAPTWPNAAVNSAIATRMGSTRVAICLPQKGVNIDGRTVDVADGKFVSLPNGVVVSRQGNLYAIRDQSGDSVRATVNASWIDVSVGLGRWPAKAVGLLANPTGNVNELVSSSGAVLSNPFSFDEFYGRYAESWRVSPAESLLSVCGEATEQGDPQQPFDARDLDPRLQEQTRAICAAAGVKQGPLADACALDVAVIGDEAAAKAFVGASAPTAVGVLK